MTDRAVSHRGKALQPFRNRAKRVAPADVWSFLDRHDLTQARFCTWIGVSPRTFQAWAKAKRFPRMIEIIITDEPPPKRGGAKSQLGEKMAALSAEQ